MPDIRELCHVKPPDSLQDLTEDLATLAKPLDTTSTITASSGVSSKGLLAVAIDETLICP